MRFLFENHAVDVVRRELSRGAEPVPLEPQVFDLLVYLLKNRGRVTSKDDLIADIWGGRIVSDSTLHSRINAVRKAIGDNGREQRLIRTIARKGIRFVGEVTEPGAQPPDVTISPPHDDRPTFAVLPFKNLSDDPAQEYFADGLCEDLISALGSWCRFPVICRHSSFIYKGRSVDAIEAGRELGARYMLEGSVRKSGNHMRITASLTDATTGFQVWADRYDREVDDVFALQDEITARIAAAVEPQLHTQEQRRAAANAKIDPAAYDLVQRGNWHHNKFTAADAAEAQRLFSAAIEADPTFARAYSSMASTKFWVAQMGWGGDPHVALQAALEFAHKAISLDDRDARGHFHMAQALLWLRRHNEAIAEARHAIALNPSLVAGPCGSGLRTRLHRRVRGGAQDRHRFIAPAAIRSDHRTLHSGDLDRPLPAWRVRRSSRGCPARGRHEQELLDGPSDAGCEFGSARPQAGSGHGACRNPPERTGSLAHRVQQPVSVSRPDSCQTD